MPVLIGGLQKVSLIDFPGKIASVVFTQSCNFRCPFCHNATLVDPKLFGNALPESEVLSYLDTRRMRIEGVVMSGGEPTLQADLKQFMGKVKDMGFCTKLDTNGTKPDIIAHLVSAGLVDFIAMDVKHDFAKYDLACGTRAPVEDIAKTIDFIKTCGIDYEFRTTVVPGIHSGGDIVNIARNISGAKKFVIQEFVPDHAMDANLRHVLQQSLFDPDRREELENIRNESLRYVSDFDTRCVH
ncbi:MAG: anaerobic ribonucleoside-triphosphate reductase activating protein [Puniceicoccales bacterium]|jgi:pyruvate formate lyase activating enzyme|nr:anaerobic ribonucleoside-triphosphate reductase activating protein [Puniceicoccales bacterium]